MLSVFILYVYNDNVSSFVADQSRVETPLPSQVAGKVQITQLAFEVEYKFELSLMTTKPNSVLAALCDGPCGTTFFKIYINNLLNNVKKEECTSSNESCTDDSSKCSALRVKHDEVILMSRSK